MTKRWMILGLLIGLLPFTASGEDVAVEKIDWHALYIKQRASAAAWKERSEILEGQLVTLKHDIEKLKFTLAVWKKKALPGEAYSNYKRPQQAAKVNPRTAVDRQIKARAVKEWPDDYSMQQWEIKRQKKAYKAVSEQ